MEQAQYERPELRDYGDLLELTAGQGFFSDEDSLDKSRAFHHSVP